MGPGLLGPWLYALALIFAVSTWNSHTIFRRARRDPANREFFESVAPATLRDFAPSIAAVAGIALLGLVVHVTGSQRWLAYSRARLNSTGSAPITRIFTANASQAAGPCQVERSLASPATMTTPPPPSTSTTSVLQGSLFSLSTDGGDVVLPVARVRHFRLVGDRERLDQALPRTRGRFLI